ncbi:MAG: transcriptional regulator [Gammaproteobacteria bacterium]|jgi:transcriptional regulator
MYTPKAFEMSTTDAMFELIDAHGFGVLFCTAAITDASGRDSSSPQATHLPFVLDRERRCLLSHMARANPQWPAFTGECEALVVFSGLHGYISPSRYTSSLAVPTWNYEAVHVSGKPRLVDDPARLADQMVSLVAHFEGDGKDAWAPALDQAGYSNFFEKQMKGIVGFEIPIERIEGKAKMSQNRPLADLENVISTLEEDSVAQNQALAARIRYYQDR